MSRAGERAADAPRNVDEFRTEIGVEAAELYAWHARPGAFARLTPPWERVRVVEHRGGVADGARVVLSVGRFPRWRWVAVHEAHEFGRGFRDVQRNGPFARWVHDHRFEPIDATRSRLVDRVEWELPGGVLTRPFEGAVRRRVRAMFAYRHRVTAEDLAAHRRAAHVPPMRVLVSGASGLIGSALSAFLSTGGHTVVRLVRGPAEATHPDTVYYDPKAGTIDRASLEGVDAIVHLAGESIASGRWTARRRREIRASRVDGTRLLADAIAKMTRRPRAFVGASAIGFYGDRGDETVDESSPAGDGFLSEVCQAWESAAEPAAAAGIRVAHVRTGVVLDPRGGALATMLPAFRLGVAGRLGSGRQWISWVALDDVIGAIHHLLIRDDLSGPFCAVGPEPVTNAVFTKCLGRVLRRPTILAVPAFALRGVLGAMADDLLLASTRVVPTRLSASGYQHRHVRLEDCLRAVLGRG